MLDGGQLTAMGMKDGPIDDLVSLRGFRMVMFLAELSVTRNAFCQLNSILSLPVSNNAFMGLLFLAFFRSPMVTNPIEQSLNQLVMSSCVLNVVFTSPEVNTSSIKTKVSEIANFPLISFS